MAQIKETQEGYEAYKAGKSKKENPYDLGSEDNAMWQKGWKQGEKEKGK